MRKRNTSCLTLRDPRGSRTPRDELRPAEPACARRDIGLVSDRIYDLPRPAFVANMRAVRIAPLTTARAILFVVLAAAALALPAGRAVAEIQRVAVQPLEGPSAGAVRSQIARMVRGHGF